jgi:FtsP/CotA-like multicopper oxidase with cupredoxin domain
LARGFVLHGEGELPDDSVVVPGPPLVLTRGETTAITVVNRSSEATTVHWHGLELESVYDGVAGWSRTGGRIAPLVLPGDSFTVRIDPPRSGTYIYHSHMDESDQLAQGMYGPLIVLDPGDTFDPISDRQIVIGGQAEGAYPVTINGSLEPEPMTFEAGQPYRLRFVQITRGVTVDIALVRGTVPIRWRALARDGADLPPALQGEGDAVLRTNTGETFDYLWTPAAAGDVTLSVRYERFIEGGEVVLTQTFRVR